MNTVMNLLFDKSFLIALFVSILAFATVVTLGVPWLEGGGLASKRSPAAAKNCAPSIMPP